MQAAAKVPDQARALLELSNIGKTFHTDDVETRALASVELSVDKGEFVSISGPSGSGKSTLLAILGLLDIPTQGEYRIDGQDTAKLDPIRRAALRNKAIGFIFQAFNLIGDLTVEENVELPLTYRGMSAAERKKRVGEALDAVRMSHKAQHLPAQLSGGQQQRVAVLAVEVTRWLVRQLYQSISCDGSRDRDALLLAARELRRQMSRPVRHAHRIERLADAIFALGCRHSAIRQRELDVFLDGQIADQDERLEDEADRLVAERGAPDRIELRGVLAVDAVLALRRDVEQAEDGEQRRLAGARRSADRHELALVASQLARGQRARLDVIRVECLADVRELEQ